MANEFKGTTIPCVNNNLIPNFLPQYQDGPAACSGVGGARPFASTVRGEDYLDSLSYSPSHIWRNVGILFAWWALYVALTIFFTRRWRDAGDAGRNLVVPREKAKQHAIAAVDDEESALPTRGNSNASSRGQEKLDAELDNEKDTDTDKEKDADIDESPPRVANAAAPAPDRDGAKARPDKQLVRNTSVFTWRNLTYTVKTPTGDRVLLDNVHGYVKPGMLGALMGSSGAGKTTCKSSLGGESGVVSSH